MSHVFISYLGEDVEFVADLTRQLEGAGFRVWMDHERLRSGSGDWREAIDQAIRDAFALIAVMTPAARESEQVMYEWMFALGVGVTVIPVVRVPTELHPRLGALQSLDFSDVGAYPWGRLIRVVQEAHDHGARRPSRGQSSRGRPVPSGVRRTEERESAFMRARERPLNERVVPDLVDEVIKAGDAQAVHKLIERLNADSRDIRIMAAQRLGEIGAAEAIESLIRTLRDEDWRVREAAAGALGKLRSSKAVVALVEAMRVGRPGPFGGGKLVPFAHALKTIGAPAVPVLIDALGDEEPRVRLAIIDILGEIGERDAIPALTGALRDPEWRVRWQAADALGRMGDLSAVPDLLAMLTDANKDVRVAVAWALGRIGHISAVEGLVSLLRDRDWRARWAGAQALWEIGAPAVPAVIAMLREADEYVRRAAVRTLSTIGAPAIPALIVALGDSNWDVRWSAASALHEIGELAVPALIETLDNDDWQVAWAAAETLKRIASSEALEAVERWREGRGAEASVDLGEHLGLKTETPDDIRDD